tara:strand:+ start:246 stop:473 length:228 start_codon:yes stop_codon:yes gene_type:complete
MIMIVVLIPILVVGTLMLGITVGIVPKIVQVYHMVVAYTKIQTLLVVHTLAQFHYLHILGTVLMLIGSGRLQVVD